MLVKNFALGGQLVETRLFMRHNDGNWAGYTYEWNAQQHRSHARGRRQDRAGRRARPGSSRAKRSACSATPQAAGRTLGLEIGQLNGDFGYPTGRTANQLTTLNAIDTLTPALTQTPAQLPVIPNPVRQRAARRSARAPIYMRIAATATGRAGTAPANLDLRYTTALSATNACDITPTFGNLGHHRPAAHRAGFGGALGGGGAHESHRDADAMPPLARHTIDTAGVQLHHRLGERPGQLQLRVAARAGRRGSSRIVVTGHICSVTIT